MKQVPFTGIAAGVLLVGQLLGPQYAAAADFVLDAEQVGGFYADGSHDNSVVFQNYFVGYGTTPGSPRTEERRSFFTFDLAGVSGTVTSASFSIQLKDFGVIYGKDCLGAMPCTGALPFADDPGTPWIDSDPGAWPSDPFEEFVLGSTPLPSALVTDEFIPDDDPGPGVGGTEVFDSFDDAPVADPFVFMPTEMFDFSSGSAEIVIDFNAAGIAMLNDAILLGDELVLTGWMPSWSFEDRTTPLGDDLVEKSELLFGLTDLVTGGLPTDLPSPFLEVSVAAVPVPAAAWLLLSAVGLLGLRRGRAG